MKEMICICCPLGCHLSVDDSDKNNIKVTGNTCLRGKKYAIDEVTSPKRMVTSIVKVVGGKIAMVSCKTSEAIEKSLIFPCLEEIKKAEVKAPVRIGDVLIKNVLNTGIDIVATKEVL